MDDSIGMVVVVVVVVMVVVVVVVVGNKLSRVTDVHSSLMPSEIIHKSKG